MREIYTNTMDMIRLAACAVNGTIPEQVDQMDLDGIFEIADRHMLAAAVSYALESAGMRDGKTAASIAKSQRKSILFDREKEALFCRLEEAGIWYMPLKGAILKDLYPQLGMREMADYDILFDASRAGDVKRIMEDLGFTADRFETASNHDVYFKDSLINFEMHRSLFRTFAFQETDALSAYYENVKERLVKDEGNGYGYHFTNEDFYVYLTAHEYKHYVRGGTGVRSLLDIYVFLKRFDALDWQYIQEQTAALGIADFETRNRQLALSLFGSGEISDEELLRCMLESGVYGNIENFVGNRLKRSESKLAYIRKRIILPMDAVKKNYPTFYKHKILLPVLPFYRLYRAGKKDVPTLGTEWKLLAKNKD